MDQPLLTAREMVMAYAASSDRSTREAACKRLGEMLTDEVLALTE